MLDLRPVISQSPEHLSAWQHEAQQHSMPVDESVSPHFSEQEADLFELSYAGALRDRGVEGSAVRNDDYFDRYATQAGIDAVDVARSGEEAYKQAILEGEADPVAIAVSIAAALGARRRAERNNRLDFALLEAVPGERMADEVAEGIFGANGMWPQLNFAESFGAARAAIELIQTNELTWSALRDTNLVSNDSILEAVKLMNSHHKGHNIHVRFGGEYAPTENLLVDPTRFAGLAQLAHLRLFSASNNFLRQVSTEMYGKPASDDEIAELYTSGRSTPEMQTLEAVWQIGADILLDNREIKAESRAYKQTIKKYHNIKGEEEMLAIGRAQYVKLQEYVTAALIKGAPAIESRTGYALSKTAIYEFLLGFLDGFEDANSGSGLV